MTDGQYPLQVESKLTWLMYEVVNCPGPHHTYPKKIEQTILQHNAAKSRSASSFVSEASSVNY